MAIQWIFRLNVLMSFVAFALVTRLYIWPRLRRLDTRDALLPLVLPHTFRFIGLSFLVPGVVAHSLPSAFAVPAAYGDLLAAIFSVAASIALSKRASVSTLLVWLFNVWGAADLVLNFYRAFVLQMDAGTLGAAYYISTLIVPPLLVTHGLIFWFLVRPKQLAVPQWQHSRNVVSADRRDSPINVGIV